MMFKLNFNNFKRILTESNTGYILFSKHYEQTVPIDDEDYYELPVYDLYVMSNNVMFYTNYVSNSIEDSLMFEQTYLTGAKVIQFDELIDQDIVLNINKG